jgi:hypothetical protein
MTEPRENIESFEEDDTSTDFESSLPSSWEYQPDVNQSYHDEYG